MPWPIGTTLPERIGNERRSTLRIARREPLGERRASGSRFQWVNQSRIGTRRGSGERRREEDVARDHVRDERERARARAPARAPSRKSRTRPACDGEPKTWTRQFSGSDALDGAVGEHDELVDALGERPQLRRRWRRAPGRPGRRPAWRRSAGGSHAGQGTGPRRRRPARSAYSSGVVIHCAAASAAAPRRAARRARGR